MILSEYVIDVSAAKTWPDFVAAFNRDFILPACQAEWSGNLDALNDFLYWPEDHPYRLILNGWEACYSSVNEHRTWDNRPVLEVVAEIFLENPQVEVVLA